MSAGTKKKETRKGAPRPRVKPLWKTRWAVGGLAAAIAFAAVGGGWWGISSGIAQRAGGELRRAVVATSAELGLRVREVMVAGRRQTSKQALADAVALERGAPILGYDLAAAKARIEGLPWIREATVERMLPDTVLISVEEREPLALWQHQGEFALVDAGGDVILRDGLERFSDLLVVIGEGAPKEAANLLAVLGLEPDLMGRVKAATWVGGRRWNLHLAGGIDVHLPEGNTAAAWHRLADYQRRHAILQRKVRMLDLRLPDQVIVQEAPGAGSEREAAEKPKGRQT